MSGEKIEKLAGLIAGSRNIVVFTGAGVSRVWPAVREYLL